jgi:hypothetical protein
VTTTIAELSRKTGVFEVNHLLPTEEITQTYIPLEKFTNYWRERLSDEIMRSLTPILMFDSRRFTFQSYPLRILWGEREYERLEDLDIRAVWFAGYENGPCLNLRVGVYMADPAECEVGEHIDARFWQKRINTAVGMVIGDRLFHRESAHVFHRETGERLE